MDVSKRICVLGLGNPGPQYKNTRHNIGFEWIDSVMHSALFKKQSIEFREKFDAQWCRTTLKIPGVEVDVHFLKPLTFMNESGRALRQWSEKFQGERKILVVMDDMDIPLGRLRLRMSGSDGGHRGLRSILEQAGTSDIPRLKIGIGRPSSEAMDHVLERFNPEERKILAGLLADASKHLQIFIQESAERAMNKINGENYVD